jgi:hypothetical protein
MERQKPTLLNKLKSEKGTINNVTTTFLLVSIAGATTVGLVVYANLRIDNIEDRLNSFTTPTQAPEVDINSFDNSFNSEHQEVIPD